MKNESGLRFRPGIERFEERDVPALLTPITSPGGGVRVGVGDFNHDGRADVAAIGARLESTGIYADLVTNPGSVAVSLGKGDGTLQRSASLSGAKGYYLEYITVSDRNGDGHLDVTLYAWDRRHDRTGGSLEGPITGTAYDNVWLGRGDGSFARVSTTTHPHASTHSYFYTWPPLTFNQRTSAADFNHDGTLDKATVDGSTGVVSVSLRNPDGSYQPPQTFAAGPSSDAIAVGDFNGDGWADIVVVNNLSSRQPTLSVLLNDGNW